MVTLPQTVVPLFEDGYKIADILKIIMKKQGVNIPQSLTKI
jgi:hypothetical protein